MAADEYRVAYDALCCLGSLLGETTWRKDLLPLKKEDIRDLSKGKAKQSEGKRDISWIWRTVAIDRSDMPDDGHFREGVRIEWAKSRARASRFTEEVSLLTEEMLRVHRFLTWKSDDWESKANIADMSVPSMQAEGWIAYAKRQAAMYRALRSHFNYLWRDVPAHVARMEAIICDPSIALPGEFDTAKVVAAKSGF